MAAPMRLAQLARGAQAVSRNSTTALRSRAVCVQHQRSNAFSSSSSARATLEPRPATDSKPVAKAEQASEDISTSQEDPNMNGNYPDVGLTSALPIKRQFRDPYGDWWDKQDRRNYGEPLHEDNDILGVFSPEEYTWVKPGLGAAQILMFIAAFTGVCYAIAQVYPDKPSAPRTFGEDGLEKELGGPGAVRARTTEEESW